MSDSDAARPAAGEWAAECVRAPRGPLPLVWADEFDKDGPPDPRNWRFETGFVRNEELQWYQPENAVCRGGMLILSQPHDEGEAAVGAPPRSGGHGRFEMRGRIDTRLGMWPAYWTLGVAGEWPGGGEIDIMEYYRGMLLANAAWGTEQRWAPKWDSVRKPIREFDDPDWSRKFHVWRMDWEERAIELSVDGLLLNRIELAETVNPDREKTNPFRQPHYVLLSLAVGGHNGGDPSGTEFPARFEVDYVRVYQRSAGR